MTTGLERETLRFALAIMAAMIFVVVGSMWLGTQLGPEHCARRTARQAETITSLDSQLVQVRRERDSLATTLHLMVCIRPGTPPTLAQC